MQTFIYINRIDTGGLLKSNFTIFYHFVQYSLNNFYSMHFVKTCPKLDINILKDREFSLK